MVRSMELLRPQCHLFRCGAYYYVSSEPKPSDLLSQGGDDLQLKVWDKRQGFEQPIITNKRCVPNNACLRIIIKQFSDSTLV